MISCVCVLKLDTRLQGRHGLLCPCTDRCFFFTCFKRTRKVFIRRFSAAFDFFPPFFENLLSPTFTWPRAGGGGGQKHACQAGAYILLPTRE